MNPSFRYNHIMLGTRILEERKSKFNGNLRVVRTLGMGTYIQSNGLTQSGGIVKTIWRQTLKRAKLETGSFLILGLGGGTVAKLIRKKYPGGKITGIEIDPIMIELGNKYLGLGSLNVETKVKDAYSFMESSKEKFDLIIIDIYNGDIFPEKFKIDNFLKLVRSHLSENGVAIFNSLYYGEKRPEAVKFGNRLKKIFPEVKWFYPEANLMFVCSI
jgi:spermidine synthase